MRIERLRLSIHSPLATTYDRITGLPTRLGALRRVVEQTARLLALRRELGGSVRVGIGFVIQPLNYEQILPMAQFAAELGVDFLDIRKDEVDVTVGLSADQLRSVAEQLASLRARALDGRYGATAMDLSDELVALTNGRPYIRRRGGECMAKYFRPTISPFGILAPCDLKAEPRFASSQFNLGSVGANRVLPVVDSMPARFIPNACEECMPSSRTGNAVYAKVLGDQRAGVGLEEQPFVSAFTTGGGNRWPRGV